jgi:hypothetical protein
MRGIGLKRAQHRRLGDIARRPRSHPIVMGNSPSATGNSLLTLRDENAVCRRRERAPFRPAAMRASHPPSCSSGIIPEPTSLSSATGTCLPIPVQQAQAYCPKCAG